MNLKEKLSHLPADKITELESITQRIVETGLAKLVMLYGSFARGDWKDKPGPRSGKKSDFDILVLTKDVRDTEDLRIKLSKMFDSFETVVQTFVETLSFVNMHLREKQYFFTEIKEQGIILYADKNAKLADEENISPERRKEIAERDFNQWFRMASTNLRTAKFLRLEYKEIHDISLIQKAAFEFQQCAENCYTAIEMVFSRTNPHEHRLNILRMNAVRFVPDAERCFPKYTHAETHLFDHLDAAYIGGRYINEEEYKVTEKHLEYWQAECQKLLEITKTACEKKIEGIGII